MSNTLRSKVIRLAHQNPEIRSHLLRAIKLADSIFEEQFQDASALSAVDPSVAALMVQSGDGKLDKVSVSKASIDAESLKPSQTTMVLDKTIQMALLMLQKGKTGGDLGAMISADNHILDGHHRWAATILAGGGKVGGYKASLKGPDLLRVLNIVSKGAFGVRNGKPGKGSISLFTPQNVRKMLEDYAQNGYGGEFPRSPENVQGLLTDFGGGDLEAGIEKMSQNVKNMSKQVPSWAPDRADMPVIEPEQVPEAASMLNKGDVDWAPPYKQAALRSKVIRLAHQNPALRPHLLPLLR